MPVDYRMLDTRLPERLGSLAGGIRQQMIASGGMRMPQQNSLASLAQPPQQVAQADTGMENLGNGIVVDKNGFVQQSPEQSASFDAWVMNQQKMELARKKLEAEQRAVQVPKLQFNAEAGGFIEPPSAQNPQGRIIPVPGFKPKGDEKARIDEEKQTLRNNNAVDRATLVVNTVDDALSKTGFLTTGFTGASLGLMPGTKAYDLRSTLDTVKANIGFSELQAMREASPTGGALGQVAVQELNMLQAVIGSIDPNQSESELRKKLGQVKEHYQNWKVVMEKAGYTGGGTQPQAPQGGIPQGAVRRVR